MSGPETERQLSTSREIPSRRVVVNELPDDYSTTPGGTCFGTTPGGTRIIYERNFLLQMRNSPLARTPPKNLPSIPGVTTGTATTGGQPKTNGDVQNKHPNREHNEKGADAEEPQFEMDI
ncbi:eukaryotic translation initiation factor 4E-binding protein 1-like [Amphiura filiformis]|uniref:eukaryotic translation initiation factor 4E-binding protein 1-like n=1 Tax=Amphiura filiformis TaxID=82378 RepID=UPI003B21C3BD